MRRERDGQSVEEASDDSFRAPIIRKRPPTSRPDSIAVAESRKRHCCNFEGCSKAYMRLEHLTRHQLNHLGAAMHCKYCDKTFTRNDLLQRHIHRHERSDCTNKRSLRHKTPILVTPSEVKCEVAQTSGVSAGHLKDPFVRPTLGTTALNFSAVESTYTAPSPNGAVEVFMPPSNSVSNPSPTRSFSAMSGFTQPVYGNVSSEDDHLFSPPAKRQHLTVSEAMRASEPLTQPALADEDATAASAESWSAAATIMPQVLNLHQEIQPQINGLASAFSNDPSAIDWKWMIGANGLFEEPIPPPSVYSQLGSSIDSPDASPREHPTDLPISQEQIADLLKLLPCELSADSWLLPHNIQQAVVLALDSLDSAVPLLHRPTLIFNSTNIDLLLVVVTYGLLIQALQPDTWQIGLQLHAVARRRIHHPDLLANRADLHFLQAMLLHEITGTYLGSRGEHERADIVHGQLVRLATRSDILWNMSEESSSSSSTQEQKWRDWVHRESTKRLAHFVFALDVQHVVHFNHTSVLTIDDMKLMLPCADELWKAPTAAHWRAARSRLVNHQSESASKLRAAVEAIIVRDVAVIDRQQFSPLQMYIIVHGLLSVASRHVERRTNGGSVFSRCRGSQAVAEIWTERVALDEALAYYELVLNDLHGPPPAPGDSEDALLANSRRYCRLARSYLHISPQDIEMAAGSLYSGGKVVLRERAQEAIRGLASQVITLAQCEDALQIIQDLCCEGGSVLLNGATISAKELAVPSMLYSAALFVWAFLLSVKRERGLMPPLHLHLSTDTDMANKMMAPIASYQLSSPQDHVSLHAQLSTPPNAVSTEADATGHSCSNGNGASADCGSAADGVYISEQCALLREHARLGDIQALDGAVQRLLRCCFARMAYSRSAIVAEQRLVIMKLSHDTSVPPT